MSLSAFRASPHITRYAPHVIAVCEHRAIINAFCVWNLYRRPNCDYATAGSVIRNRNFGRFPVCNLLIASSIVFNNATAGSLIACRNYGRSLTHPGDPSVGRQWLPVQHGKECGDGQEGSRRGQNIGAKGNALVTHPEEDQSSPEGARQDDGNVMSRQAGAIRPA
jgi:hypothetical protein